jgi:hypothetical protein
MRKPLSEDDRQLHPQNKDMDAKRIHVDVLAIFRHARHHFSKAYEPRLRDVDYPLNTTNRPGLQCIAWSIKGRSQ